MSSSPRARHRAADLDRGVNHQVVAGLAGNGDRAAREARGRIDRAHVGTQQTGPALRFVDGGDAKRAKLLDHAGIGA